jgi:nitrate reductase assembly molybdenum cofactor insertion protein NarJ
MPSEPPAAGRAPEERSRAETYPLLAHLLHAPPTAELLGALGALESDGSELGQALAGLAQAAREMPPARVAAEYRQLFEGVPKARPGLGRRARRPCDRPLARRDPGRA